MNWCHEQDIKHVHVIETSNSEFWNHQYLICSQFSIQRAVFFSIEKQNRQKMLILVQPFIENKIGGFIRDHSYITVVCKKVYLENFIFRPKMAISGGEEWGREGCHSQ